MPPNTPKEVKLTFSDYFSVSKNILKSEEYFDISLASDLPVFIDPFNIFYSKKPIYKKLHDNIIKYLIFLRDTSKVNGRQLSSGVIEQYYSFGEVKQTWLGFSAKDNKGHGLGKKFATTLNANFNALFEDFGVMGVSSHHLEKLTLITDNVGKDTISDFTTNLIVGYLAQKTEEFTLKFIGEEKRQRFAVEKAEFDYKNKFWKSKVFTLPRFGNDYVLLTPLDLLTKDDTWINKNELLDKFSEIPNSISDRTLREKLFSYFQLRLRANASTKINRKTGKEVINITQKAKRISAKETIKEFPEVIDYYIKKKEESGDEAIQAGIEKVGETEQFVEEQLRSFASVAEINGGLSNKKPSSFEESLQASLYFKECVELHDGYENLYYKDSALGFVPIEETLIQKLYWFVWNGNSSDLNRDPSNGLGKPDFTASNGKKDKTVIEFKLASSSSLKENLKNQLEKYKEVNNTKKGIWIIIFFTLDEEFKLKIILRELGMENMGNVVVVDARMDNKTPASKIKSSTKEA
jgi:hypothetical protein